MTDKNQQSTKEQEFWEKLGWIPADDGFYEHPDGDGTYYNHHTQTKLPPIDLPNIEKYAFPKLAGYRISMTCSPGKPWKVDIYNASHEGSAEHKDLATAFKGAILEVIHLEVNDG